MGRNAELPCTHPRGCTHGQLDREQRERRQAAGSERACCHTAGAAYCQQPPAAAAAQGKQGSMQQVQKGQRNSAPHHSVMSVQSPACWLHSACVGVPAPHMQATRAGDAGAGRPPAAQCLAEPHGLETDFFPAMQHKALYKVGERPCGSERRELAHTSAVRCRSLRRPSQQPPTPWWRRWADRAGPAPPGQFWPGCLHAGDMLAPRSCVCRWCVP